jgi:nucleoside-diphosphate-sugar epimerase
MAGDYRKGSRMKMVVIGGSGLIGKKLVNTLRDRGHEALAASPASGINTLTGVGLSAALEGAAVVVDVTNSPSFEAAAVLSFFETWSCSRCGYAPSKVLKNQ